jgi:hypothetical protein
MGKFTGGDIDLGSTVQTCSGKVPDSGKDKTAPISIRACMFFDGTLNNRTNVEQGKLGKGSGGSYDNELSNIAILEGYWLNDENADFSFSVYVEGIGTTNFKSDSDVGAATGALRTGIIAKVASGTTQIVRRISRNYPDGIPITDITLDVFGFSRGAAAARYFIFATLNNDPHTLKERLAAQGYSVDIVKVDFVGLFDTVAAYGVKHDDNTKELHLDSIRSAKKVVQLAAAEEHRKNFQLTNINSAINGIQIFLPGMHSDIGGGYVNNSCEEDLQILDIDRAFGLSEADQAAFDRDRRWLLESGWYLNHEIKDLDFWNELKVTRKGISNSYSLIPLRLMAKQALENDVKFDRWLGEDNPIPEELLKIQEAIISARPTTPNWLFVAEHG